MLCNCQGSIVAIHYYYEGNLDFLFLSFFYVVMVVVFCRAISSVSMGFLGLAIYSNGTFGGIHLSVLWELEMLAILKIEDSITELWKVMDSNSCNLPPATAFLKL